MPKLSSIDLLESRVIYLDWEIDDECAREIIKKLLRLDMQSHKDITMYINSAGGSVASGFAIYDVMNMIKSDVSTIGIGKCASMASILLINGAKGKKIYSTKCRSYGSRGVSRYIWQSYWNANEVRPF